MSVADRGGTREPRDGTQEAALKAVGRREWLTFSAGIL